MSWAVFGLTGTLFKCPLCSQDKDECFKYQGPLPLTEVCVECAQSQYYQFEDDGDEDPPPTYSQCRKRVVG